MRNNVNLEPDLAVISLAQQWKQRAIQAEQRIAELEGKLKECYCYTPEHISELFPPPTRPAPPMPAYKVGPVACQQRMKEAGQPYPRTCPSCGLGPCNRRDA